MTCLECGSGDVASETIRRCGKCGEYWVGKVGCAVLDAATTALREELVRLRAALDEIDEQCSHGSDTWKIIRRAYGQPVPEAVVRPAKSARAGEGQVNDHRCTYCGKVYGSRYASECCPCVMEGT